MTLPQTPLDIQEGDLLTVDGRDYPIRSVAEWYMPRQSFRSIVRIAIVEAETKRSPAVAGGKRGPASTYLTGLYCTPIDPVDPEARRRLAIDTPYELKQTFVQTLGYFYHLVLEDVKTT